MVKSVELKRFVVMNISVWQKKKSIVKRIYCFISSYLKWIYISYSICTMKMYCFVVNIRRFLSLKQLSEWYFRFIASNACFADNRWRVLLLKSCPFKYVQQSYYSYPSNQTMGKARYVYSWADLSDDSPGSAGRPISTFAIISSCFRIYIFFVVILINFIIGLLAISPPCTRSGKDWISGKVLKLNSWMEL